MFGSYWNTMLKTAVMATGEFDFGDLYSEEVSILKLQYILVAAQLLYIIQGI